MILSLSSLLFAGYLYLIIPFIIFLLGWVKLIISIPVSLIVIYIVYLLYRDSNRITKKHSPSRNQHFGALLLS